MNKLIELCPDFPEWPERWMGLEEDYLYGKFLLDALRPFAEFLAESGMTSKTIKRHYTNLWFLGGEIIRNVSLNDEYHISAEKKLRESVDAYGGLYCRHMTTEAELNSYESTCRKLHKYLKANH